MSLFVAKGEQNMIAYRSDPANAEAIRKHRIHLAEIALHQMGWECLDASEKALLDEVYGTKDGRL